MVAEVTQDTSEFSEDEKDAVLRFLGYPNWASLAQSIQLGMPAASQPLFLVFDAFRRIRPPARARVRLDLCRALEVEEQIASSGNRLKSSKVGTVTLNANELTQLKELLTYWTTRIADGLGVIPNPYSQMQFNGGGGGINAPVTG